MPVYDFAVTVRTQYLEDQSNPDKDHFVFAYAITIKNTGDIAAQLISRHWVITDANNKVQEVRGLGVVEQALRKATRASEAGTLRRVESIRTDMWILMVEAGVALFLLVFIVWWTMFAGRKDAGRDEAQPAPGDNDKTEP